MMGVLGFEFMKGHVRAVGVVTALSVASLVAGCGDSSAGPVSPYPEADGLGVDGFALADGVARFSAVEGMRSFIMSRNGVVLAEEYFNETGPDDPHDVRSVTKSFTSALIGIAIDQGLIEGVDLTLGELLLGPVVDELPEAAEGITIRDLLTMSGGFQWDQLGGGPDFNNWARADDQIDFVLDRPIVHEPGSIFEYSDGAVHLLSAILTEASGMLSEDFAAQHLLEPLGSTQREWLHDNRGYNAAGVGIQVTPRDMLAFGEMYLNGGVNEGARILSQEWVEASTRPQIAAPGELPYGPQYGYLFWIGSGARHPFYMAVGYGGQFIVVAPEAGVVVVTTCDWSGIGRAAAEDHWFEIITTVVTEVLEAVD